MHSKEELREVMHDMTRRQYEQARSLLLKQPIDCNWGQTASEEIIRAALDDFNKYLDQNLNGRCAGMAVELMILLMHRMFKSASQDTSPAMSQRNLMVKMIQHICILADGLEAPPRNCEHDSTGLVAWPMAVTLIEMYAGRPENVDDSATGMLMTLLRSREAVLGPQEGNIVDFARLLHGHLGQLLEYIDSQDKPAEPLE